MLIGDFLAMQHANMARYEATSKIDVDNMLFGDFLAMQKANIKRYATTSKIDEDNMLVGEFIVNHPNFSWKDNYNNIIPQGPQFQQLEKKTSLEDILGKFIEKTNKFIEKTDQFMRQTEINFQNQNASIKNLEIQMGQMAFAISARVLGTLASNTEVNPKESVTAITTKSEVQLLEIHVKRSVSHKEMVPSTDEEHVEQTKQTTDIIESSGTPQVKATVPINPYEPLIPFP
ncbi:Uncharacterized protein Adt_03437 [Abeliophyllum distichum]|uniref:Uncharacterized protein n=1 Tax=Abeliophyllum distichum TaxID=126358 RepID=A0ABD1VYI3_9LAMI